MAQPVLENSPASEGPEEEIKELLYDERPAGEQRFMSATTRTLSRGTDKRVSYFNTARRIPLRVGGVTAGYYDPCVKRRTRENSVPEKDGSVLCTVSNVTAMRCRGVTFHDIGG